jgi:hypothetical protein
LPRSQRFDYANRQIGWRTDLRRRFVVHAMEYGWPCSRLVRVVFHLCAGRVGLDRLNALVGVRLRRIALTWRR